MDNENPSKRIISRKIGLRENVACKNEVPSGGVYFCQQGGSSLNISTQKSDFTMVNEYKKADKKESVTRPDRDGAGVSLLSDQTANNNLEMPWQPNEGASNTASAMYPPANSSINAEVNSIYRR